MFGSARQRTQVTLLLPGPSGPAGVSGSPSGVTELGAVGGVYLCAGAHPTASSRNSREQRWDVTRFLQDDNGASKQAWGHQPRHRLCGQKPSAARRAGKGHSPAQLHTHRPRGFQSLCRLTQEEGHRMPLEVPVSEALSSSLGTSGPGDRFLRHSAAQHSTPTCAAHQGSLGPKQHPAGGTASSDRPIPPSAA